MTVDRDEFDLPTPDWSPRSIRVDWWNPPRILRFHVGDISVHDLYAAEAQAFCDQLTGRDYGRGYSAPAPDPPYSGYWYTHAHPCRPGRTINAEYGVDGDWFQVCCGAVEFRLSRLEAADLARRLGELLEAARQKVNWKDHGF